RPVVSASRNTVVPKGAADGAGAVGVSATAALPNTPSVAECRKLYHALKQHELKLKDMKQPVAAVGGSAARALADTQRAVRDACVTIALTNSKFAVAARVMDKLWIGFYKHIDDALGALKAAAA